MDVLLVQWTHRTLVMSWWGSGVQWVARRQHWWGGGGIQLFRWPVPAERCWNTDPLTPITPNDSRASPTTTHTHTRARSTAVTPFRDITAEHTQNNAHIHALTSSYPYIPHLMFLWNIAVIYIYISPPGWLASCTRPRSDKNTLTHYIFQPSIHFQADWYIQSCLYIMKGCSNILHIVFIKMTAFLMFLMSTPAIQDQLFCGAFEKKSGRVK